jgi:CubicO group peptidase (beta-lactamase class C family)
MKYCNTNYYLLGMLIEKLTGKRYSEYLVNHIFEPLEMTNSRLDNAKAIIANRVSGYTLEDGELKNAEFTSDTWAYSEGGVITTIEDLAKLESSLYTEKLIKRKNLELMWTPTKLNDGSIGILGDNGAGKPNYYGLGWAISDYKNHKLILAGGNKPGYTCTFFRFIDDDLTVIILSNLSSSPLYGIAGEIAELYLPD